MDRDHDRRQQQQVELIHRLDRTQFDAIVSLLSKSLDGSGASERAFTAILNSLQALNGKADNIMSAISDFVAKQKAFNTDMAASIDGIVSDIEALNAKIQELQDSQGTVTPEDQALIDEALAQGAALRDKIKTVDEKTPPPPPLV